jgi:hypothetical protein
MDEHTLTELVHLISDGKITEIEAERLLNAYTRLSAGVPTGFNNPDAPSRPVSGR